MTQITPAQSGGLGQKIKDFFRSLCGERPLADIDMDEEQPDAPILNSQETPKVVVNPKLVIVRSSSTFSKSESDYGTIKNYTSPIGVSCFYSKTQRFGYWVHKSANVTTFADAIVAVITIATNSVQTFINKDTLLSRSVGSGYLGLPIITPIVIALLKKTPVETIDKLDIVVHTLGLLSRLISGALLMEAAANEGAEEEMTRIVALVTPAVDMFCLTLPTLAKCGLIPLFQKLRSYCDSELDKALEESKAIVPYVRQRSLSCP